MGIAYGVTTNFQATKASLQDDILINIDGAASERDRDWETLK